MWNASKFARQISTNEPIREGQELSFQVNQVDQVPNESLLRLYGTTKDGQSVCCLVEGFFHYCYINRPVGFSDDELPLLVNHFNDELIHAKSVVALQPVQKEDINYYKPPNSEGWIRDYLRVIFYKPNHLNKFRDQVTRGGRIRMPEGRQPQVIRAWEDNHIKFPVRFMLEIELPGCSWVTIPAGRWRTEAEKDGRQFHIEYNNSTISKSTCSLDARTKYSSLQSHEPKGEQWGAIGPTDVLSFDIEVVAPGNQFPDAKNDPVTHIAAQLKRLGQNERSWSVVLHTGRTAPIDRPGVQQFEFPSEGALLKGFAELIQQSDPDVLTGYNITGFDLPYLFERADRLGILSFRFIGRLRTEKASYRKSSFQSKQRGKRDSFTFQIDGRLVFDMLEVIRKEYNDLSTYTLNAVSRRFLGQEKEDVHHSMIRVLYQGSDQDRRRLASYCEKDAALPQLLMDKLMLLVRYVEQARVNRVPIEYLLTRGALIKTTILLTSKAMKAGFILPLAKPGKHSDDSEGYEGALVLKAPDQGWWTVPIPTLDFSSLYPSCTIAYNMCKSTLLRPQDLALLQKDVEYETSPEGHSFVKPHLRKGLLPQLYEELLAARKVAKGDMAAAGERSQEAGGRGDVEEAAKWDFIRRVQDARQTALKLSANAAYGYFGAASTGHLPSAEVCSSITAYGRQSLQKVIDYVESTYTVKNGCVADAKIIYGDTDSVMVVTGYTTVKDALDWMYREAPKITKVLFADRKPMNLAPEKVLYPAEWTSTKHYTAGLWTKPDKMDYVLYKGNEAVRRDNCELLTSLTKGMCAKLFREDYDIEGAYQMACQTIEDLYNQRIDLGQLVITKSLSRESSEYVNAQTHSKLADKMRERGDPAPRVGDRIPYVMIEAESNKVADMAEDPLYVLEHEIPINTKYYIENQLQKPLTRFMTPIVGEKRVRAIFEGEHTRKRIKTIPSQPTKGSILGFVTRVPTCKGCHRGTLDAGHPSLCRECLEQGLDKELLERKREEYQGAEGAYRKILAHCQQCQGSDRDPVLCMARDCPILYKRRDLQSRSEKSAKELQALGGSLDW